MFAAKRLLLPTVAFATAAFCVAVEAASAQSCQNQAANLNVVEISLDGQQRAGSGVILTYDGHIVTAAHVLLEGLSAPYPLIVFARQQSSGGAQQQDWQPATIRRIDKLVDLAILKLDRLPSLPSIAAAEFSPAAAADIGEICLSGFGIQRDPMGQRVYLPFDSIRTGVVGMEVGYVIAETAIRSGFSGGAALLDGKLLGLILRRRAPQGSYIIPSQYIFDFAAPLGIYRDTERNFTPGVPPQDLATEVRRNKNWIDKNREQLAQVYRSMDWDIRLRGGQQADFEIVLKPQRAFPDQIIDGYFIGQLQVYFDNPDFQAHLNRTGVVHSAEISAAIADGEVTIENLDGAITTIKGKYLADRIDLANEPVSKFVVTGRINYPGGQRGPISKELTVNTGN